MSRAAWRASEREARDRGIVNVRDVEPIAERYKAKHIRIGRLRDVEPLHEGLTIERPFYDTAPAFSWGEGFDANEKDPRYRGLR